MVKRLLYVGDDPIILEIVQATFLRYGNIHSFDFIKRSMGRRRINFVPFCPNEVAHVDVYGCDNAVNADRSELMQSVCCNSWASTSRWWGVLTYTQYRPIIPIPRHCNIMPTDCILADVYEELDDV